MSLLEDDHTFKNLFQHQNICLHNIKKILFYSVAVALDCYHMKKSITDEHVVAKPSPASLFLPYHPSSHRSYLSSTHQFQIRSVTCARWTLCRNIERAAGFRHHELSIECTNAKRSPGRRHHRLNKILPKAQSES